MAGINPSLAPLRNYRREMQANIEAQIGLMPQMFQAQSIYAPLESSLNLQNLDSFLNGTQDSDYTTYGWKAPVYKTGRRSSGGGVSLLPGMPMPGGSGGFPGMPGGGGGFDMPSLIPGGGGGFGLPGLDGLFGGDDKPKKKLVSKGQYVATGTAHRGAQRGFLDMYQNDIVPTLDAAQRRSLSYQREGDIADVQRLSPAMLAALRASNPEAARLLDSLNADAQQGMDAGATLDPSLRREVSQSVRGGQAARGMGLGPVDLYTEALQTGSAAEALRQTRRANAASTIGLDQQFYGNPFDRILNRSSQSNALAPGIAAQGDAMSQIKQFINPESPYAGDIYNTNFNAMQSRNNAASSNTAALWGAGINAVGHIAGGAMGAI